MVERDALERMVKDALSSLYDYAALEIHPLVDVLPERLLEQGESRAEGLRRVLAASIDKLKPPDVSGSTATLAWRPYRILHGRYVECLDLKTLEADLGLSARQLRREHARSLEALAALVWEQIPADDEVKQKEAEPPKAEGDPAARTYKVTRERLDLVRVVEGVMEILQKRVESAQMMLRLDAIPESLPRVWADRVILRQILLSLINQAFHSGCGSDVLLDLAVDAGWVELTIQFQAETGCVSDEMMTSLDTARHWARRLGAKLICHAPGNGRVAVQAMRFVLSLPTHRVTVLVVDDQDAAVRMFTRYLSRLDIQVVGIREPDAVLSTARKLQPQCITLDLMMPGIDGWEILQSLRNDPDTREIPVIVCSVWNEPELAASLGAADFLRKPVMQKHLLDALSRLDLLDTLGGSRPGGS